MLKGINSITKKKVTMKKYMMGIPAALLSIAAFSAKADNGKHHESAVITWQAEQAFADHFGPKFPVAWSSDKEYDIANFERNNTSYQAFYTPEGQWVGTVHDISFNQLPNNAKKYINKKYGRESVLKVEEFRDNAANDEPYVMLDQPMDGHDHYFVAVQDNRHGERILLRVDKDGEVGYFSRLGNDVELK